MEAIKKFAHHLVNELLLPREGDVVSISGEIYNLSEHPLQEISLIEEIALDIRKKKAFPFLEISTENLKNRFFTEMTNEIFTHLPNFYNQWIDSIAVFIEVSWKNISEDFSSENQLYFKQMQSLTEKIWQKIFQQNKKILFLNYPSDELAKLLKIDYESLLQTYLSAVNIDNFTLQQKAAEMKRNLAAHSKFFLRIESDILNFSTPNDDIKILFGKVSEHPIMVLPTGFLEMIVIRNHLNGIFTAEKVYYKQHIFSNVKINFEDGFVRFVSIKEEGEHNEMLKNAITNSKENCLLTVGFNENISEFTDYFHYDRCIYGNYSLILYDNNFERIVFSNKKAEIVVND